MHMLKKAGQLGSILLGIILAVQNACAHPSHVLTQRQMCDLELVMNGGFAPLTGFLKKIDYDSVVENMRLADGAVWPMPITLDVSEEAVKKIHEDNVLELRSPDGTLMATMAVEDAWQPDKAKEALCVYGTTSLEHPGVAYLMNKTKGYYVGGAVTKVAMPTYYDFVDIRRTPQELKAYFQDNGIYKVIAFQTRNPMHRAHLELTYRAAKNVGAHLLIHPVVGLTKPGDVDYRTRVRCYKKLMAHYPQGTATLSLLPLAMRMAGPREALWHALIRKNYGCTHFIIGRDHAGPGSFSNGVPFYGPYDSQDLVMKYAVEIGMEIVPFKEMVYIPDTDSYEQVDQVPPGVKTLNISGTQLRNILNNGLEIPSWFTYPEVAQELRIAYPPRNKQGFTIFFTGLSGSGKSTIANALAVKLNELQDRPITLLDGDIVRQYLSSELGFSKEHRALNVRRVGFVANEISKNGGIAICALIAPYEQDRKHNRDMISARAGYIEVYLSTSLADCEERDVKGLYAKARAGKIENFTGITDPYEVPIKPEITIDTAKVDIDQVLNLIINHLKKERYFGDE